MNTDESYLNSDNHWLALDHDLNWLEAVLQQRDVFYRANESIFSFKHLTKILLRAPIDPVDYRPSAYAALLEDVFTHTLDNAQLQCFHVDENLWEFIQYVERVVLLLAMAPCLRPDLLECFRVQDDLDRRIVEFGGRQDMTNFRGFLPTGETASFIMAGQDLRKRALVQAIIHPKHYLFEQGILYLSEIQNNEPPLSSQLVLSKKYIDLLVREQYPASEVDESNQNRDKNHDEK